MCVILIIGDNMSDRTRRTKKKKLKIGRIIIALVICIIIILAVTKLLGSTTTKIINKNYYISSTTNSVQLYSYNEESEKMEETEIIYRGTKVKSKDQKKIIGDINYVEITVGENKYYINEINLTEDEKNIVI